MMNFDFSGQTVIVTGGSNGIGLACAKAFASSGAKTWIFDVESERPGEVAASFGSEGFAADVSDRAALEVAFAAVGVPDVVVANAGIGQPSSFESTTKENWDRTLQVNLSGIFHTVQIAASLMKPKRKGAIVLTASVNAFDGEADLIAYNASKAGVLGILRTAANELGPYQIRINAICPGLIRTRFSQPIFEQPKILKELLRHTPLGRAGLPEEVAKAVVFLASEDAGFITGTTLFVDGGQMSAKLGVWSDEKAQFETDRWLLL